MTNSANRIFLVGARACGKTTVGRCLAALLRWECVDTDHAVVRDAGMPVAEMVRRHGWGAFRARESAVLRQLCGEAPAARGAGPDAERCASQAQMEPGARHGTEPCPARGTVIATGGGMVLAEENRRLLRACGRVFYLHAPAELLAARLAAAPEADQRPALTRLDAAAEAAQVLALREPLYRAVAHHVLDAARSPEEVANTARALWAQYLGGKA